MSKPGDKDYLAKAAESAAAAPSDSHGSVRETLESILIAFVLAFIFRAFVVEAFVIPTGSMAPTLLGQHVQMDCPECGYRFTMGPRDQGERKDGTVADRSIQGGPGNAIEEACPMCRYPIFETSLPLNAGDRILVLKYVYTFNEPTRWDVVVFKNPTDPDENYIKRLVGLPNEQLLIAGGDVFTRPFASNDESDWTIESKPDFVQRAVWQPVYHSNYFPLDGGATAPNRRRVRWTMPWRMLGGEGAWSHVKNGPRFEFDASKEKTGELAFDTSTVDPGGNLRRIDPTLNFYEYNMFPHRANEGIGVSPFRDMRIAATVAPQSEGLRVTLTASDFDRVYRAVIEPDGAASIQSAARPGDSRGPIESLTWKDEAKAVDPVKLPIGSGTRVELWSVDGELSLFVNDSRVQMTTGDRVKIDRRPTEAPRASRANEPIARVGVSGASATLRAVDLDRDLYYTDEGMIGTTRGAPAKIKPGHYYCLGDNSPQSQDGRRWNAVDPWVMEMMKEKDTLQQLKGYVPADLMIGRAFFVYFPAGYRVTDGSPGVLPNFGEMRFIH